MNQACRTVRLSLALVAALVALPLLHASCGDPSNIDCSGYVRPVCGSDGVTYANDCYAAQAGVSFLAGPCPFNNCAGPVCGTQDGTTYLTYHSDCWAQLSGAVSWCPNPGQCPRSTCAGPVCGSDGNTYETDCCAELAAVTYTPGACPALR